MVSVKKSSGDIVYILKIKSIFHVVVALIIGYSQKNLCELILIYKMGEENTCHLLAAVYPEGKGLQPSS